MMVDFLHPPFTRQCLEELNRETALYSSLVVALGCKFDSDPLRLQLKNCRKRAYELAKQLRGHLLPHLRGSCSSRDDLQQYEKLWITFISCLELLLTLLVRTVTLARQFPFAAGHTVMLVNTGLTEPLTRHRFTHTVHCDTADTCSDNTTTPADWENRLIRSVSASSGGSSCAEIKCKDVSGDLELEDDTAQLEDDTTQLEDDTAQLEDDTAQLEDDIAQLEEAKLSADGVEGERKAQRVVVDCRDIRDLRDMLREMIETVDVKPWTIEPRIDASKFECKSLYSCSETSSAAEEVVSVEPDDHHRRRKCVCLVSLVLLTVLVFATVLGACIALLT
ncbi:hypothetical protein LSAT2_031722 [Lamellibrachia satsuma]|nr:hypothetical protein LSAT2_031722 [Lamellibrachia satsuma]